MGTKQGLYYEKGIIILYFFDERSLSARPKLHHSAEHDNLYALNAPAPCESGIFIEIFDRVEHRCRKAAFAMVSVVP